MRHGAICHTQGVDYYEAGDIQHNKYRHVGNPAHGEFFELRGREHQRGYGRFFVADGVHHHRGAETSAKEKPDPEEHQHYVGRVVVEIPGIHFRILVGIVILAESGELHGQEDKQAEYHGEPHQVGARVALHFQTEKPVETLEGKISFHIWAEVEGLGKWLRAAPEPWPTVRKEFRGRHRCRKTRRWG